MEILCPYCMDDKWIGDGRVPCPKCNPDGFCCLVCGKETDREDNFCSDSCKKFYLII